MERAAARGKVSLTGRDLGGEFPVQDFQTNQGGLLQVRIDGVALLFADRQVRSFQIICLGGKLSSEMCLRSVVLWRHK